MRALDEVHRQQLLAAFAAVRKGGSAATIVQNAQQSATPQGWRRVRRARRRAPSTPSAPPSARPRPEAQAKIDLLLKQEAAVRRRDERKRLKDEAEAAVRGAAAGAATRDQRVQKLEAAVAKARPSSGCGARASDSGAQGRRRRGRPARGGGGRRAGVHEGRQTFKDPLEDYLGALPFESFEIEAGTEGDTRQHVATLKALVRLTGIDPSTGRPEPLPAADLELLDALSTPREYVVRVYVLRGLSLIPQDSGGTSDPYLQLTLGTTKVDNRSAHLSKVKSAAAHLFTSFELRTHLPGDSLLEVSVLDHDMFGRASDDLIGTTRIDLEDRVFSPTWQGMQVAPTPVEGRPLYALSKHPQGQLEMWVDVLTPEQAAASPMFIAPPPEQWERADLWKAADMPDDRPVGAVRRVRNGEAQRRQADGHRHALPAQKGRRAGAASSSR